MCGLNTARRVVYSFVPLSKPSLGVPREHLANEFDGGGGKEGGQVNGGGRGKVDVQVVCKYGALLPHGSRGGAQNVDDLKQRVEFGLSWKERCAHIHLHHHAPHSPNINW